ncbi:MAG: response regulator [bacterium]|nr:response regulator [bacterium]
MGSEKILIVDDEKPIIEYLERVLKHLGYTSVMSTEKAEEALNILQKKRIDLLLADIHMPGMGGLWLLGKIKEFNIDTNVIVITASHNFEDAITALNSGADRYILKPLHIGDINHVIKNVLEKRRLIIENREYQQHLEQKVVERTREIQEMMKLLQISKDKIKQSYIESVQRLTVIAEYRDEETGSHIKRIGLYAKVMAEELGLSADDVETIYIASPMHDLGKVSIPDHILLKQGPLTLDEFEMMKQHTIIGAKILHGSDSEFIKTAEKIALTHHERWDGSGYPYGIKKEEIPLESRILAIADTYDALRSSRPYKPPVDHITAYRIITEGDAKSSPEKFDPELLKIFKKISKKFEEIYQSHL